MGEWRSSAAREIESFLKSKGYTVRDLKISGGDKILLGREEGGRFTALTEADMVILGGGSVKYILRIQEGESLQELIGTYGAVNLSTHLVRGKERMGTEGAALILVTEWDEGSRRPEELGLLKGLLKGWSGSLKDLHICRKIGFYKEFERLAAGKE